MSALCRGAAFFFVLAPACGPASRPADGASTPAISTSFQAPTPPTQPIPSTTGAPAAPIPWDPLVLELFDPEKRDPAIQALVARGKYDREPPYRESSVGPVKEVVLCPQPGRLPLVAVFLRNDYDEPGDSLRNGQFVVVRSDGTLIPVRGNANSLDGYFGDLTRDGVPELVTLGRVQFKAAEADVLRIRTLTEEFPDILEVLLIPGDYHFAVHQAASELPSIQIQRAKGKPGAVLAEYRWNSQIGAWQGPSGTAKLGFLRVTPGNEDSAALSLSGKPSCRLLAESVARELPEVRAVMDHAGPEARPGGIDYTLDPEEVEFSIGFHHEERFENVFFVSVTDGKLEVSGPAGPIPLTVEVQREIAAACDGRKNPSKQRPHPK